MKRGIDRKKGSVSQSGVPRVFHESRVVTFAVLVAVASGAFVLLLRWDHWFLNFDGGSYMALAKSTLEGHGYRFPDGSFATFRGPIYSAYLAAGWLVLPITAKSAIWIARVVLMLNAAITADLARRLTGRLWLAAAAGLLIAVQPLPLISGGMFLVPDALAALFVLAAVWLWIGGRAESAETARILGAGFVLGVAFLTKETAALGLLIPLAAEARRAGLRSLPRVGTLLIAGWIIPVGAWLVVVGVASGSVPDWLHVLRNPAVWAALVALLGGLAAWTVVRARSGGSDSSGRTLHPAILVIVLLTGSVAALVAAGAPLIRPLGELGTALQKDWDRWLYLGTPRTWLLVGFLPAVAWSLRGRRGWETMAAVGLVAVGFAQLAHAALGQLGPRNGVLFAYGGVLLMILWCDAMWRASRLPAFARLASVAAFTLVLLISNQATGRTNSRFDYLALTWDAPAVRAAATWLEGTALPVAGTPDYLTYLWFLQTAEPKYELIRFVTANPTVDGAAPSFRWLASWVGRQPSIESDLEQPVAVNVARSGLALVAANAVVGDSSDGRPSLVVVTGNLDTSASAFDGGVLLPFMEAQPNVHKVYESSMEHLPQWIVVYQIDGPLVPHVAPLLVHMGVDVATPTLASDQIVMDDDQYRGMITSVLSDPIR
jgi:hypothetical protein